METIKITGKLTNAEKETIIVYDNIKKKWYADTTLSKHVNRFKKQGWIQKTEYIYEDGAVCGGIFEGSERSITIRNIEKKQMSEAQMGNLFADEDEEE